MAKASIKDLDETRRIMGRLAAMPHKPHVSTVKAKKNASKRKAKTKDS